MVAALSNVGGVNDPAVLAVMGRVPREVFVPHFWSLPPPLRAGGPSDVREWHIDEGDDAVAALGLVYDMDRALAIRLVSSSRDGNNGLPLRVDVIHHPGATGAGVAARATSTASAPRVVASMLELLDLQAVMRVLEIGTGSGYNAALLRELVGPDGQVTSVDIDAGLVALAARRMEAAGYPDVRLVAADGYVGNPEGAPFDRVVATVGCVDVAPAWLDQLAPKGFCLIPLQHDGWHPLTRIAPSPGGVTGVVVGRAGFVAIQGHQSGHSPWPNAGRIPPQSEVEWSDLPDWLAHLLRPERGRDAMGGRRYWDLAYLLALEDRRGAFLVSLVDGPSSALIGPAGGRIGQAGPDGTVLRDRLLEVAHRWDALGRPSVGDYTSTFRARSAEAPHGLRRGQWEIERVDFHQTVTLTSHP